MNNGFKKLEKNALGCVYAGTFVVSAIVLSVLTGIVLYFDLLKVDIIMVVYTIIMIIGVLNVIISPYFRYNRYRYKLDDEAMEIVEGYIFVSHNIVPIERIQNIELQQGPIDRMFGVSKMTITTGGSDVTVRYVSKEVAAKMSDFLKKTVNVIVKENREDNENEKEC